MGAGASSNKKGSRAANEQLVSRLDEEQEIADAARSAMSDGRTGAAVMVVNEGKTSPSPKTKRRPMPIPMHVFETDDALLHSNTQNPAIPKTPRSPHAEAGHLGFQRLLSLDDSEIAKFRQQSSPRARSGPSSSASSSSSSPPRSSPRSSPLGRSAASIIAKRGARVGKKMSRNTRNNSTSSWYSVRTTMGSAPKDATIRCISTVILRHMSAHRRSSSKSSKSSNSSSSNSKSRRWDVFDDSPEVWVGETKNGDNNKDQDVGSLHQQQKRRERRLDSVNEEDGNDDGRSVFRGARTPRGARRSSSPFFDDDDDDDGDGDGDDNNDGVSAKDETKLPSVRRIREFIDYVFTKAQLEIDGLIIAFIYLERLLERASRDNVNLLYNKNWRTLCFISLVLASKIWDDFSMDNADFAVVWKPTTLKRVNQLERKVLELLRYNVSIPASDYAACYFKLRSLVTSLGLKEDELQMVTGALRPLSSNEAYKLEALSESYQRHVGTSIQRQQSSGLSTPLLSADRRTVNASTSSNGRTPSAGGVSPKMIRKAKSGRRLINQDKSKSFSAGGIGGGRDQRQRRAAPASVEHLMYAASTKTGNDNDNGGGFGGSRQPWKNRDKNSGSKTADR